MILKILCFVFTLCFSLNKQERTIAEVLLHKLILRSLRQGIHICKCLLYSQILSVLIIVSFGF